MKTGAVIAAAGRSSRMGAYKPMLKIGDLTIAEHIIQTFRQSGVNEIVVVTGYQSDLLKHHLESYKVAFLHNEHYETTQMFDSACIGFRYLIERCERLLFSPIDIPLFRSETVNCICEIEAPLVYPITKGRRGHPILLSSQLAFKILQDDGEGGLKGAIARCASWCREVDVDDEGILFDADTPDEYDRLLSLYQNIMKKGTGMT